MLTFQEVVYEGGVDVNTTAVVLVRMTRNTKGPQRWLRIALRFRTCCARWGSRTARNLPGAHSRSLQIIVGEADRLSRLSDNLLRLTTLASADATRPRAYRLDQQIRRIILAAEPQWV